MKRHLIRFSTAFCLIAGVSVSGCNVSVDAGPGTNFVFSCDTDSNCATVNGTPYVCQERPDVGRVCVEEGTEPPKSCKDDDDDGWGISDPPRNPVSQCPSCPGEYRGCEEDCNDSKPGIYPGYYDPCDGTDSNCDGNTDTYVMCAGPDFDDSRTPIPEDRRGVFCRNLIGDAENKSPTEQPGQTEFECRQLPSKDNNKYCVPVPTSSNTNCSGTHYACNGGKWSCVN